MVGLYCPKYRYKHLNSNDHGVILSNDDVLSNGWESFLVVAQGLARRTAHAYSSQRNPKVVVGASNVPNAFAYEHAGYGLAEPVIVLTGGFISELQSITGQAHNVAAHELEHSDVSNILRTIWGDLSNSDTHLEAFAALLAHVTLAVVMHHEIAHISLGHLQFYQKKTVGAGAADKPWAINEAAAGAALDRRPHAADLLKQAMEMDADVHALQWTRNYLKDMEIRHSKSAVSDDPATNAVWSAVLTTHLGRRYLLACGFSLLFLLLGARDFNMKSLSARSHPPGALRLAALVQVEANLSRRHSNGAAVPRMSDAVRLALGSWASLMQLRELSEPASVNSGGSHAPAWTVDHAMAISGLSTTLNDWDLVGSHLQRLAAYRRKAEEPLRAKRLLPEAENVDWFSQGTID